MTEQKTSWQVRAEKLYFWSFLAWAFGLALMLISSTYRALANGIESASPMTFDFGMYLGAPGMIYFWRKTRNLSTLNGAEANKNFDKVMAFQSPLGMIAIIGAILGLVPFLVNFLELLTLNSANSEVVSSENYLPTLMINASLMVPWISLYGFVTTYFIARSIEKQRRKSAE